MPISDYTRQRQAMIENQLRPNRIDSPALLDAMGELPREVFCPPHLRGVAYGDDDVDLGGAHLIEPLAAARLVLVAAPERSDKALVIGCDTGYVAAVLSRLVAEVHLLVAADGQRPAVIEQTLNALAFENVRLTAGDVAGGLPTEAPFDIVILAGSVTQVPEHLFGQLRVGGRLVAVINGGRAGKLTLCRKFDSGMVRNTPYDARIPLLRGMQPAPAFQF